MLHARRHLFCNGIDRPKRKKVNDKLHTCCHFLYMGQMDQNKKRMTMSMQLIVVLLFLPNASLIFFYKWWWIACSSSFSLQGDKNKIKLDNDNEHVAHHCPLCFKKNENKEELRTCCHLLHKGTQRPKKGRWQACGPSSSLIFKK